MNTIASIETADNPFDQIKNIDEQGNEYWLARELMPILGYQQWRRLEDAINRAIAACKNIGIESENHFLPALAKSTGGRPGEDFKLSRYGCYLTAMNGDSRKPEIAAAQNYFAVKTREAELAPHSQELLSQLLEKIEQQNKVIQEQGKALAKLNEVIAQLQAQVQTLLPPSADSIPPGWNAEVWRSLPPQDQRHFRFLYCRRRFRPSQQGQDQPKALPAINTEQMKQNQRDEVAQLVSEVSSEEKQRLQAAKLEALREFWTQAPKEDQENMPF
ncbi:DNA-damage-inducible protein (plasmid) [Nostoc sp. NIES-3756]|uniref:BRO family protein n=1 Tax=Nostoc sp. NIES-3756 TaxID=1751286 RepID=UPI00071EECDA|nr:BRO family protein [Nostoc sp. NIES-3756]BAT56955.1 DNA-damage-inducible protein [Nostoc sp. NIES-3756]